MYLLNTTVLSSLYNYQLDLASQLLSSKAPQAFFRSRYPRPDLGSNLDLI